MKCIYCGCDNAPTAVVCKKCKAAIVKPKKDKKEKKNGT